LTTTDAPRTLASVRRRIARRRLGTETALFAALLVAMIPAFVLDALERALPPLSVVVALPADADARGVEAVLRKVGVRRTVERGDGERIRELWSTLDATGAPPTLVEATLWPAAAVDATALRTGVADAVPAAVVDLRPHPRPTPRVTLAAGLGLAALALVARWRLVRAVRRILEAEAATLVLVHRFGASRAWVDARLARPIARRARRGALAGVALGAAAGLGWLAAAEPALVRPWSGVAGVVAASTALAATLTAGGFVRVVTRATARRLDAAGYTNGDAAA
jgi:hypothetical protein